MEEPVELEVEIFAGSCTLASLWALADVEEALVVEGTSKTEAGDGASTFVVEQGLSIT